MSQPRLFENLPRRAPIVRMHVIDAGFPIADDTSHLARFQCGRCGAKSEWQPVATITEGKRGIPCPTCNDPVVVA